METYHEKPGSPGDILHYGVKGMRWGHRKTEGAGGQASSGKTKSTNSLLTDPKVMNKKVSDLRIKDETSPGSKTQKVSNSRKLTDAQKKLIAGAAVVGGFAALNVAMRGKESGAFNSYALRGKAFLTGKKVPFKINKDLAKPMSADDILNNVAKQVNPDYKSMGGKMNCRRCTYVHELRRRGFDVHATTSASGWGQSESGVINAVTKDGKDFFSNMSLSSGVATQGKSALAPGDTRSNPVKKIMLDNLKKPDFMSTKGGSSSLRVLEELAKQPEGARGEVVFKFPGAFGHSMHYEVIKGVPHIFDSQKGTLYNASKLVESKWDGFDSAEITRLDNVDLDLNFLTRWADNN